MRTVLLRRSCRRRHPLLLRIRQSELRQNRPYTQKTRQSRRCRPRHRDSQKTVENTLFQLRRQRRYRRITHHQRRRLHLPEMPSLHRRKELLSVHSYLQKLQISVCPQYHSRGQPTQRTLQRHRQCHIFYQYRGSFFLALIGGSIPANTAARGCPSGLRHLFDIFVP